jgi:hypothetical protein
MMNKYIIIREAMETGVGSIGEKELFPVFKRITKRQGELCGEIRAYCDAYGNEISLQEAAELNR